jgi:hypothetical protein
LVLFAKSVTVFLNESDPVPKDVSVNILRARECTGFLTYVTEKVDPEYKNDLLHRIATDLDSYLYGFPSENAIKFQNGVYLRPGSNHVESILSIKTMNDYIETVEMGKEKQKANLLVAQARLEASKIIKYKDMDLRVSFGDRRFVHLTC